MLLNDKVPFRMQWPLNADIQVNGAQKILKRTYLCILSLLSQFMLLSFRRSNPQSSVLITSKYISNHSKKAFLSFLPYAVEVHFAKHNPSGKVNVYDGVPAQKVVYHYPLIIRLIFWTV